MRCPVCKIGVVLAFGGLQRRCDTCDRQMIRRSQRTERAEERVAELEKDRDEWRTRYIAIAEGIGYANHAEGQGGVEVAPPDTIIEAWRENERNANMYIDQEVTLDAKDDIIKTLVDALKGWQGIVSESRGIAGLHLNGDVAEWDDEAVIEVVEATDEALASVKGGVRTSTPPGPQDPPRGQPMVG